MRILINLCEGFSSPNVPFDVWGFWIMPDGQIEQVSDHAEYAEQEFGSSDRPIDAALDAGWIRVFCPYEGSHAPHLIAAWTHINRRSLGALRRLIRELPEFDRYAINGRTTAKKSAAISSVRASKPKYSSVVQHYLDNGGDIEHARSLGLLD